MWPIIIGGAAYVIAETKIPAISCESKDPIAQFVLKSSKECDLRLYHIERSDSSSSVVSATAHTTYLK